MDKVVRVGLIGAGGNMKSRHIPGFKGVGGVELVAVANRSRASGEKVASEFGIPKVYDRWEDLLASSDIDAVCIGTWPYMHCPITIAALDSGKHVLCEARMAMNLAEAKMMLEASRRHPELVTQIVPGPPTLEVDAKISELLKSGYLGQLRALELSVLTGFLNPDAPLHWRQDKQLSGYNILSMGIWYECIQRWLGQATSVAASGVTAVPERKNASGQLVPVTVPDHVDILATFRGGVVAHLRFSSIAGLGPSPELWLFGTTGTLRFDPATKKLFGGTSSDKSVSEISIPSEQRIGWRVEQEFVSAIRGKESITRTNFQDGVLYMEFTEAVARSLEERRTIDLPLK